MRCKLVPQNRAYSHAQQTDSQGRYDSKQLFKSIRLKLHYECVTHSVWQEKTILNKKINVFDYLKFILLLLSIIIYLSNGKFNCLSAKRHITMFNLVLLDKSLTSSIRCVYLSVSRELNMSGMSLLLAASSFTVTLDTWAAYLSSRVRGLTSSLDALWQNSRPMCMYNL